MNRFSTTAKTPMSTKTLATLAIILSVLPLIFADEPAPQVNPKDKLVVETVLRLKSFDLE